MIATSKKIRFTVAEYFRMSEAGVFGDRRVELIDGKVVKMHAQANPHRAAVTLISILLHRHFSNPADFWMVIQGTYLIEPSDAPDPDFHLFACRVGTHDTLLPDPFLVIEVSHTTYRRDSGIKLRKYAAAGVKEYWIVNLPENRVEVYRKPENLTGKKKDWRYASRTDHKRSGKIKLLAYPKISLPVSEMLP